LDYFCHFIKFSNGSYFIPSASSPGTLAELSAHDRKVEGLNPTAAIGKEKMPKKVYFDHCGSTKMH
jgi:hypothetical protein